MPHANAEFKLCLTTVDKHSSAKHIATTLLQQKLVACVNISSPMCSMYYWQDKLVEEQEFLLLMKTRFEKVGELRDKLLQIHPYEVPEFIMLDIQVGKNGEAASAYLEWINTALG